MPYIADYLWQDVLAAAKALVDKIGVYNDDVNDSVEEELARELKTAIEAAEGGSSTEGTSCTGG